MVEIKESNAKARRGKDAKKEAFGFWRLAIGFSLREVLFGIRTETLADHGDEVKAEKLGVSLGAETEVVYG